MQKWLLALGLAFGLALALGCAHAVEVVTSTIPATGMKSWKQFDRGISIEFLQLGADAAEATYSSRDLSHLIYKSMRGYCVFGSVVRNETDAPLSYRVVDWRVVASDGKKQRLRTKSQWVDDWKKQGVNFGWSILPDEITLEVGDWALGYTPIKLTPGESFNLIYVWRQHGKLFTSTLQNMSCPAEPNKP